MNLATSSQSFEGVCEIELMFICGKYLSIEPNSCVEVLFQKSNR